MHKLHFFGGGENVESLRGFIEAKLDGDYFSSLSNIKAGISINREFDGAEFVAAIISEGKLYALVGGGASLSLVRDGHKVPLLKTLKSTSSIVTGRLKEGDVFEAETSESTQSFQDSFGQPASQTVFEPAHNSSFKAGIAAKIDGLLAKLPERRIVIGEGASGGRARKASLVGVVFLVILGISIYFGVRQREQKLRRQEYEPILLSAMHDYEEALSLASLSEARARELILASRDAVYDLRDKGVEDERLNALESDISKHLGEIAGIYDEAPTLFLDLSIISSGFEANKISLSGGLLRILDAKNRRLAGVEVANKRTNVIAGPDYLPDAVAIASYEDRSFILSTDGIREVTGEVDLTIKPDGWEPENVLIYAFAGNIYVLDKDNDQIWRYSGVRDGFLEKEPWLGEGFTRDTGDAAYMAIDGLIWTVSADGKFKVYSLGAPANFSVTNETSPLTHVTGFYTDGESDFVYVLDSGSSRIAVIEKNGTYVSEYVTPELSNATDVVVDEKSKLIIFLADSKLYAINARHLTIKDKI